MKFLLSFVTSLYSYSSICTRDFRFFYIQFYLSCYLLLLLFIYTNTTYTLYNIQYTYIHIMILKKSFQFFYSWFYSVLNFVYIIYLFYFFFCISYRFFEYQIINWCSIFIIFTKWKIFISIICILLNLLFYTYTKFWFGFLLGELIFNIVLWFSFTCFKLVKNLYNAI